MGEPEPTERPAQTKGFEEQFGFVKAELLLDFPAPGVGKDDVPGLFLRLNGFIGEQIPRLAAFALSHNDQPELSLILGVSNGQSQHPRAAMDATMRIPQQTHLSPGAFATRNLPGFALVSCGV